MTAARRRQRGVTLLEALIAVALLAALSAMLAPAIHSVLRLSARTLAQAEDKESLRTAENALTQILTNAVILDRADADMRITGDDRSLSVTSLAGSSVGRRFTLNIEGGKLSGEIAALSENEARGEATEILNAGARAFSYYGRVREGAPLAWTQEWKSASPPRIVRLQVASNVSADKPIVIDVPIAASATLQCAFDPVSRRCRD